LVVSGFSQIAQISSPPNWRPLISLLKRPALNGQEADGAIIDFLQQRLDRIGDFRVASLASIP